MELMDIDSEGKEDDNCAMPNAGDLHRMLIMVHQMLIIVPC